MDQLLDRLQAAGVALLIDVRAVPISRKPGFSKRILGASAEARGIRYLHLQALGTPKAGRQAARSGKADLLDAIFSAHLATKSAQAGLAAAIGVATAAPSCLLCFERDPHFCHRRLVAEAISIRTGQDIVHL